MPTAPNAFEAYAKTVREVYAEAERHMLKVVAKRAARGIDEPGWASKKLTEVHAIRNDIRTSLKTLGKTFAGLQEAIETAYAAGGDEAVKEMIGKRQTINMAASLSKVDHIALRTLITKAVKRASSTHLRILRAVEDGYRDVIQFASAQFSVGTMNKWEAVQNALNRFSDRGITGFVDAQGRRWSLASYSEMATRSALGQASVQGHVDRLTQGGYDLVYVSDHAEECPLCRPWEGKVLSISGKSEKYPSLNDAIAAGLYHPGCGHTVNLYVEGETKIPKAESNPKLYEDRQKQRYNERMIRKWKKREAVAITPQEKLEASNQRKAWQAKQRAHVKETGRRRQYDREKIRDSGDPGGTADKLNVLNPPPLKKIKAVPKPKIIDEKRAREHTCELRR